jgi:hypothetical protein
MSRGIMPFRKRRVLDSLQIYRFSMFCDRTVGRFRKSAPGVAVLTATMISLPGLLAFGDPVAIMNALYHPREIAAGSLKHFEEEGIP